jgi:hypothetical protein
MCGLFGNNRDGMASIKSETAPYHDTLHGMADSSRSTAPSTIQNIFGSVVTVQKDLRCDGMRTIRTLKLLSVHIFMYQDVV